MLYTKAGNAIQVTSAKRSTNNFRIFLDFFLFMSKLILHVKTSAVFLAKAGNAIQVPLWKFRVLQSVTTETVLDIANHNTAGFDF